MDDPVGKGSSTSEPRWLPQPAPQPRGEEAGWRGKKTETRRGRGGGSRDFSVAVAVDVALSQSATRPVFCLFTVNGIA